MGKGVCLYYICTRFTLKSLAANPDLAPGCCRASKVMSVLLIFARPNEVQILLSAAVKPITVPAGSPRGVLPSLETCDHAIQDPPACITTKSIWPLISTNLVGSCSGCGVAAGGVPPFYVLMYATYSNQ
jgi:hypothetical protein